MWIGLLVVGIIIAAILGIAGAGIYAVPIVLLAVAGAAFLFMRSSAQVQSGAMPRTMDRPQDTEHSGRFERKGHAHKGQEAMTPEQMEALERRR